MSYEDTLIIAIAAPVTVLLIVAAVLAIYFYERKYHSKKITSEEDIIEEPMAESFEPKSEFFQAKALKKRVHIYYAKKLNIPESVIEYYITFLLEDGREEEYLLSQEMFERIEEGEEGMLVLVNDSFFDFCEGEECDGGDV